MVVRGTLTKPVVLAITEPSNRGADHRSFRGPGLDLFLSVSITQKNTHQRNSSIPNAPS